ncbi:polysaccharide deacetylase family protein [Thiolapillus sp.]
MSFSKQIKQSLRRQLSRLHRDRPALLGFLFHGLFEDEKEIGKGHVDAQQGITRGHMQQFIEHFLQAGYKFISPEQNPDFLNSNEKCICITFDDGYANNLRMLPLLEQYDIPATFYITTGNVEEQQCFWWDVVYRERHRQGANKSLISREQKMLKERHHRDIIGYLQQEFGTTCLQPWSDTDRPMTIQELREFSRHSLVHIGNHTRDHYLLDQYSYAEVEEQISRAQRDLENWLGNAPSGIAYPNGNYSNITVDATKNAGLQYGLSLDKHKTVLPMESKHPAIFTLGRFTLWGRDDINAQCEITRSDIRL